MRYYKIISDGYFISIGLGDNGMEISETEYNYFLSFFLNKPKVTANIDYRLREDLTWEAYDVEPIIPDPSIEDKAEAYDIIVGEVT